MRELIIRNRQRTRRLNVRMLRRVTCHIVEQEIGVADYEIGFHFVEPDEMASVNEKFLQHCGSTDVITFDYSEDSNPSMLRGEVFICVADAVHQAREFRTTWQAEIVRYVIHSLLHLRGFEDLQPAKRRVMKREENRLLRLAKSHFAFRDLGSLRKP